MKVNVNVFLAILLVGQFAFFATGMKGQTSSSNKNKKLIIILADGVRYDYLDRPELKGIKKLVDNGVKAKYVEPIFPANSYPNWYSIVTGKFAESHGMVGNFMWDPKHEDTFMMYPQPNASLSYWWDQAEPIWVTAENMGIPTAMYWWDGCQVKINNVTPSYCQEYRSYIMWSPEEIEEDYRSAFKEITDNFKSNTWKLALVYFEAVDSNGHIYGTDSPQRVAAVEQLDRLLGHLQELLEKQDLDKDVNLVVVSDHGMVDVDIHNYTEVISIQDYVDPQDMRVMLGLGSAAKLYPKEGKVTQVYEDLAVRNHPKGLAVYLKENIPEKYHFKNNARAPPILIVAQKGYFIRGFDEAGKTFPVSDAIYPGHHGYDPYQVEEMRTIFMGRGPGLRSGLKLGPLMMTDHYNVFCRLLGIEGHKNNGSLIKVQDMFSDYRKTHQPTSFSPKRGHFFTITFIIHISFILIAF